MGQYLFPVRELLFNIAHIEKVDEGEHIQKNAPEPLPHTAYASGVIKGFGRWRRIVSEH
jgi:hypothetical protein